MTDNDKPIRKHKVSAKEHLAGVKAAQVYIQALSAQHLLKDQDPVKNQPIGSEVTP